MLINSLQKFEIIYCHKNGFLQFAFIFVIQMKGKRGILAQSECTRKLSIQGLYPSVVRCLANQIISGM